MFREEELLSEGKSLPVLSPELRSRILAAALEARERRTQGRRVLASALVLFGIVGFITWTGPMSVVARHAAATAGPGARESSFAVGWPALAAPAAPTAAAVLPASPASAESSGPSWYCRSESAGSPMGDDWRMVEAEFKSREEFMRRVHM